MHILNRKKVYCLALLIQKKFRVLAKKPHKYMNPKAFEDGVRVSIYIYKVENELDGQEAPQIFATKQSTMNFE